MKNPSQLSTSPSVAEPVNMRRLFLKSAVATLSGSGIAAAAAQTQSGENRSQQAILELQRTLDEINSRYFVPARGINDPSDIIEGQRYLMQLLSAGIDYYLEGDPAHPYFVNMVSPVRRVLGDNPDARYFFTPIYGDRFYRIRGKRLGKEYISFTVHEGSHDGNWNGPGIGHINHRGIRFSPDGSYELIVGPQKRGLNWLKTTAKAVYIVSRNYYEHLDSAAANRSIIPNLSIEAVDPVPPPQRLNDEETAKRLLAVANFMRVSTINFPPQSPETVPSWMSLVPNKIGKPFRFGDDQMSGFGAIDNTYAAGYYSLEPDQAIVMEGRLPKCYFANVVLWNRYMQCGDYLNRRISLNRRQMQLSNNNRYKIVISAQDPKVPNWIDTGGRRSGMIFWRFLLADADVDTPQCTVVPVATIAANGG